MRSWVYIHLVTKGAWDQKRNGKKAYQQKDHIKKPISDEKVFLRKNSSIISRVLFNSLPIHMQIYVQSCVLSSLKISGLLDCQFTHAEFQSSCSETRSRPSLAMPLFKQISTASSSEKDHEIQLGMSGLRLL